MLWHRRKREGVVGIMILIRADWDVEFMISMHDEKATQHVARRLRTKVEYAQTHKEEFAGNAKNYKDDDEEGWNDLAGLA